MVDLDGKKTVTVQGNASQSAAATGRGGLVVIHGDASSRCGISMKGVDIVVRGSVGHMSAFMAQKGRLVVCGDAGPGFGDSMYEGTIYVGGSVASRGADAEVEEIIVLDTHAGNPPDNDNGVTSLDLIQALLAHGDVEGVLVPNRQDVPPPAIHDENALLWWLRPCG